MTVRVATRLAVTVVAGVLAIAGLTLVWDRKVYHEWPWSAYPTLMHYCGRDYLDAHANQGREQITATPAWVGFKRLGRVPGFLNHGEVWTVPEPNSSCGSWPMWVRTGADRFEEFTYDGGP